MEVLHHEVTIACDPARAFDLFTTGMGTWWDPAFTPDAATFSGIDVDPRVGGEVALRHGAERHVFGVVEVWEPGSRYAQSFWLAMSPAHPTRVSVEFRAQDGVCEVLFEHGGWDAENRSARATYRDWPHLLGRYAQAAARLI